MPAYRKCFGRHGRHQPGHSLPRRAQALLHDLAIEGRAPAQQVVADPAAGSAGQTPEGCVHEVGSDQPGEVVGTLHGLGACAATHHHHGLIGRVHASDDPVAVAAPADANPGALVEDDFGAVGPGQLLSIEQYLGGLPGRMARALLAAGVSR